MNDSLLEKIYSIDDKVWAMILQLGDEVRFWGNKKAQKELKKTIEEKTSITWKEYLTWIAL